MRDYDEKSDKSGPIIIILLALLLLVVCLFVGKEVYDRYSKSHNINTTTNITEYTSQLTEAPTTITETTQPTTPPTEIASETTAVISTVPFSIKNPSVVTFKLKNNSNVTVGKYGYIGANKAEFKAMSQKQFLSFCKKNVDDSELKWLTIRFEDGTGIVFNSDDYTFATYCELDSNCYIKKTIGKIVLNKSGEYDYISDSPAVVTSTTNVTTSETITETSTATSTTETTTAPTTQTTQPTVVETTVAITTSLPPQQEEDFFAEPDTTARTESNSDVVYVTKSGTKYHKSGCSYLASSKIEISLSDAKAKGFSPCSRCFG